MAGNRQGSNRLDKADPGASVALRRQAEEKAKKPGAEDPSSFSEDKLRALLHELRVHQIELEMQNEELRNAQAELDVSRARYFDLYDLAPVGYITVNEQGLILEANLKAAHLLGAPRGALKKQPVSRFILAEDQDIYYLHRKALFDTGTPNVCELRMKQAEGSPLWIRLEAALTQTDESGIRTCRVTLSDITRQRLLQAKLVQTDRMTMMGLLAAGVAHEINNPLSYVLYNIESLADEMPRLTETIRKCRKALQEQVGDEMLAKILGDGAAMIDSSCLADLAARCKEAEQGSRRIKEIAKGLSCFSRVEKGDLEMVNPNQSVEHALNMAESQIKCRAVLLKEFGDVPMIYASEGKLVQVFLNLIINAAHAIEEGTVESNRITVRTWADPGNVFAEITDTGCGILPQNLEAVFEPFFTTKGPERGTGLGLSITRQIVTDLGGDIKLESTVGKGTRFLIRFPIQKIEVVKSAEKVVDTPEVRGRLLVVDDEEAIRDMITKMLRDHEVVAVDSGRAAQDILKIDSRFDLILCDLMMPEVNGVDLHIWLKEHRPELVRRLIFVTGGVFTPTIKGYLEKVSNLCIEKPFERAHLKKIVNESVLAFPK